MEEENIKSVCVYLRLGVFEIEREMEGIILR